MEVLFAKLDSFLGHTSGAWIAWLTLGYLILTAVIAWYARRAWKSSQAQILQSATTSAAELAALDRARMDALRPLIFLDEVALLPPEVDDLNLLRDQRYVEVTISNHGPGPAVDIRVIVRAFPCGRDITRDPVRWSNFLNDCRARAGTIPPLRLAIESIGPQTTRRACVLSNLSALVRFEVPDVDMAVVFFSAQYGDVFGTRFEYPTAATPGRQGFIHRSALLQQRRPPAPEGVISLTPATPVP